MKVISKKKRSSLELRRFFRPNQGDLKKKVIVILPRIVLFISFSVLSIKGRGRERGVWVGMLNILGGQNCPKNMKLAEILTRDRHLKASGVGQFPHGPPTSYATNGWGLGQGRRQKIFQGVSIKIGPVLTTKNGRIFEILEV